MEQLGNAEDRLAIQELNQRYAVHIDFKEIEQWVGLFTQDAFFDEREFGTPLLNGHDDIRAYGGELAATVRFAMHHMTTHSITDLTATRAHGIAFAIVEALMNDGAHARHHVVYKDRYEKVGDQWLIAERILKKTLPS